MRVPFMTMLLSVVIGTACGKSESEGIQTGETLAALDRYHAGSYDEYSIGIGGPGSAVINVIEFGDVLDDFEYIESLVVRAEAAKIEALARARREHAMTDALRLQITELERSITSLRQRVRANEQLKRKVAVRGKTLERLWRGDTGPEVLSAMEYFFSTAGVSQAQLLRQDVESMGAEHFVSRGRNPDGVAYPGGNALHFMQFLKANRLNIVIGSPAHVVMAELYELINGAVGARIADLEAKQDELRAERAKLWGPVEQLIRAIQSGDDDSVLDDW